MDRTDRGHPVYHAAPADRPPTPASPGRYLGFLPPEPPGAVRFLRADGGRRPPGSLRARMAETGNPAARGQPGLCRPAGPSRPPAGPPRREQARRNTGFLSRGCHPGAVRASGRLPEGNHRARSASAAASFRWGVGRRKLSRASGRPRTGNPASAARISQRFFRPAVAAGRLSSAAGRPIGKVGPVERREW